MQCSKSGDVLVEFMYLPCGSESSIRVDVKKEWKGSFEA